MNKTNTNDQDTIRQANENDRDRLEIKPPRNIGIPGGAGAAGQVPIKGNDLKQKDDPFQPDNAGD